METKENKPPVFFWFLGRFYGIIARVRKTERAFPVVCQFAHMTASASVAAAQLLSGANETRSTRVSFSRLKSRALPALQILEKRARRNNTASPFPSLL